MGLGPLMLDLEGVELAADERELLLDPRVCGVILFSRNYQNPEQLTRLCQEIHQLRTPQLLIAVDQEGGKVQRFREGFVELPAMARLGALYDYDREHAHRAAERVGWLMASELRSCGVDFSFAPVLDLSHGVSGVIGTRAFHRSPDVVSALAQSWMRGMHLAGMGAVGKHFPGHGGVAADSHFEVPIDSRSYGDLLLEDLVPFQRMVEYGIEGIMPAHVFYDQIDPEQPAGFSPYWLQRVLRRELGFVGTIFSDDLAMEGAAVSGDYPQRAAAARTAGCDVVLVCNHRDHAIEVLQSLPVDNDPLLLSRLLPLHGRGRIERERLLESHHWQVAVAEAEQLHGVHTGELEL